MSHLFDSIKIRDVEFANRAWVSPMCQYSAIDGVVGQWHQVHLGAFATGGPGLIMVEATGVVPEGPRDEKTIEFQSLRKAGIARTPRVACCAGAAGIGRPGLIV